MAQFIWPLTLCASAGGRNFSGQLYITLYSVPIARIVPKEKTFLDSYMLVERLMFGEVD
jgi:hypothetical protein